MSKFEVLSVNISEKKGTLKKSVNEIELTEEGVLNDAHAGKWHRQVSLLAHESIIKAESAANTHFPFGTFAENITTKGIELHKTNILDRFVNDVVEMEVTQIGKKCHAKCAIGKQVGNCIMPIEGIFARVRKTGKIKPGDTLNYIQKVFNIHIITLSDRASTGEYKDISGEKIKEMNKAWAENSRLKTTYHRTIIPDDPTKLEAVLNESFANSVDIIFTTGSTGIGERDIAPEVISPMLDKEIPGIMDMIRLKYGMEKPNALLSRSIAGIKNKTLLFALPGNPKAVKEYMTEIHKLLFHSLLMVHGINAH